MKTIALKSGQMPRDVEGFPEGCERSCDGALYLSSSYKPVTDGELAHIKASLPSVYEQLYVLADDGGWAKGADGDVAATPQDEPAAQDTAADPGAADAAPAVAKKGKKFNFQKP